MKLLLVVLCFTLSQAYRIGVGIADVTGPPVEITFMGYGKMEQRGSGIHTRQFSRAFIIEENGNYVVFVSIDCSMIGHGLRKEVVTRLEDIYGSKYNVANVMLSATHTHSTPGGFLQHMLFDLSTLGFVKETFNALASGIVESIKMAHGRLDEGNIYINEGELLNANINRSPTAYLENPSSERAKYQHDVDKTMTQMKFESATGVPLGVISWFAVHPTSMNNTNTLISSDNVGYASLLFEARMNPGKMPGKGSFVAAFASSNLGDVSPNIRGPRCKRSGQTCDVQTSACHNKDPCIASGPGEDMTQSTSIIAHRLMNKAWELWTNQEERVTGSVKVVHQYVDMATQEVNDPTLGKIHGCLPAMGYSFGAGTTDGPGAFSFTQGTKSPNALWNALRDFLAEPTPADVACHAAKPILLATGQMDFPFEWQPRIVSTQLALIGNIALVGVPGEFTTMSGRRLRDTLKQRTEIKKVIIAGLVNTYSDYIVTPEEYQVQRYEGASTIYGPHTLSLYLHQYQKLAEAIVKDENLNPGPEPAELMNDLISLTTPVIFDTPRWQHHFGDCVLQPASVTRVGQVVRARFVSGNPRNNLQHNDTYLSIEKKNNDGDWIETATDASWETRYHWTRTSIVLGNSEVEITWTIPESAPAGVYRIRHFGHYKYIFGGVYPYQGISRSFKLVS